MSLSGSGTLSGRSMVPALQLGLIVTNWTSFLPGRATIFWTQGPRSKKGAMTPEVSTTVTATNSISTAPATTMSF